MSKEIWKQIPGWENYSISNYGNVRNNETMYILKHTIRKGYHGCALYKNREMKIIRIHNLMIRVFTNNWDMSLVACHIDGDKENNNIENIKLVTQKENIMHKKLHNTQLYGSRHVMAKLNEKKVKQIKKLLNEKKDNGLSHKQIGTLFGVCETTISNIKRGLIWRHVM